MADWTTIADTQVDPNAPVTSELMTALRDNPVAIAEGAVGAPKISVAALDASFSTAGGTGTYVFAKSTTASDVAFGSTRAGSVLRATSALCAGASGQANFTFVATPALSGTWRCMGYYDHETPDPVSGGTLFGATLWLRIS